jgi:GntR family transcriptional regulator/MocR family aminotransferase
MIVLDAQEKKPLYARIFNQLKGDILSGEINPGTKLPSGRALSSELCVSRNTVDLAYSRLADEGFIRGVPRVGYFVEARDAFVSPASEDQGGKSTARVSPSVVDKAEFDFMGDRLLPEELPRTRWQRLVLRSFWENDAGNVSRRERFGDDADLREEIRKYVYRFRNIACDAFQIFPATDELLCLELACLMLRSKDVGSYIGMEDPCCDRCRRTFARNGFDIHPVGLDDEGASIGSVAGSKAKAVHLTPSCNFPTGRVMTRQRRDEFADWARKNKGYIVENDSGYHYYYGQKSIPAIYSTCPENVIYIAGLSDVLFPGGAVSWMILPGDMASELRARLEDREPLAPFLVRRPLELYMKEGCLESHLRRMRRRQGLKRKTLIAALKETFGNRVTVSDTRSGIRFLVRVHWSGDEDKLVRKAREVGVAVRPASRYWHGATAPDGGATDAAHDTTGVTADGAAVLLHCGGISAEDIPRAVRLLSEAWDETTFTKITSPTE